MQTILLAFIASLLLVKTSLGLFKSESNGDILNVIILSITYVIIPSFIIFLFILASVFGLDYLFSELNISLL